MGSIPTRGSLHRLKVMYRLLNIWDKQPSMRLCQLITNAQGPDNGTLPNDLYYLQDDFFLEHLERFYASL